MGTQQRVQEFFNKNKATLDISEPSFSCDWRGRRKDPLSISFAEQQPITRYVFQQADG